MSFFQELNRRNVIRVAVAYVVTGWLLIEVSATLEETLRLPEWADTLLAFFLILFFPVALFISWAYEITPDGIRREKDLEPDPAARAVTGRRLNRIIMVVMAAALGYFAVEKFVPNSAPDDEPETRIASQPPASGTPPASPDEGTDAPNLSIAVLPFVNMSSDPEQEYFSDGLTEELLNLLAGIRELKVAARTSSFFYKDKMDTIPLSEIARQLEVAHILEGSVRKGGNQIRITAQLIKADSGFHLWSDTWDRTLDDVFAIQDEIAAAVTDALKITLLGDIPHATPVDVESLELTMQGRFFYSRRQPGDVELARDRFEAAVELDPNNAKAWAGLVPIYWFRRFGLADPDRARLAAENAVRLDPENPEAVIRRGQIHAADGEYEEFKAAYLRALELGPDNALVLSIWAGVYHRQADVEKMMEFSRRAVQADPLYLVNVMNNATYAMQAGLLDEAEAFVARAAELAPFRTKRKIDEAWLLTLKGRHREALEILETLPDEAEVLYHRALALHSDGQLDAARDAFAGFAREIGQASHDERIVQAHAWFGDLDLAFQALELAIEANPAMKSSDRAWTFGPFADILAKDPRWEQLLEPAPDYQEYLLESGDR